MTAMQPLATECAGQACSAQLCQQMKRELGYFSFLSSAELDSLSEYFNCRRVTARDDLWRSGDPCDYVAFIVSGKVQLKVDTEFPGKQVVVGVFSRGAAIGTSCVVGRRPRNETATAMEDTGLIVLTHGNISALIDDQPKVGMKLLQGILLSETIRLQKAYDRLASIF